MKGPRLYRAGDLSGRQRYRLLTSLIVPRPIGWIGTKAADDTLNLAPFSYFNGVSAAPMLVSASIGRYGGRDAREAGEKDTLLNIRERECFSVNVVSQDHLEAMVQTAGEWPRGTNEFHEADLVAAQCETVDAPFVADAAAVLECRLFRIVDLGEAPNTLVIGEVTAIRLAPDLEVDEDVGHVDVRSLRPVGRLGLDEYTLLGELRHVPRPTVDPREDG